MSDLGGARQDLSRHRWDSKSVVRQRKDLSGYGAPQIELHQLDARGRRRHRDGSHPGKSRAPAGLISCASPAAFRGVLSIVDVEAADDFGVRANADPDRASRLTLGRVAAVGGFNVCFLWQTDSRIRGI